MSEITVYEKRTCSKCRELNALLTQRGIDFDRVDYVVEPLGEVKLRSLLSKAGLRPRDVLRTREAVYRELGLADESLSDDALVSALVEQPELLQRPIVERGDRAVLARPVDEVLRIID